MRIKDAALVAAAVLSHRYITDRFLPDKAIDLIDEAAARAAHRDRLDARRAGRDPRRIMQLEIEREALKKEKDAASSDRLAKLEKELAELQEQAKAPAGAVGDGEGGDRAAAPAQRSSIEDRPGSRSSRPSAPVRPEPRRRAEVRHAPSWSAS